MTMGGSSYARSDRWRAEDTRVDNQVKQSWADEGLLDILIQSRDPGNMMFGEASEVCLVHQIGWLV